MIKLGCWNVRGLNSPLRQKEVKEFINTRNIEMIGLLEVKVREPNCNPIINRMFKSWVVTHNCQTNSVSRIWVAWNPNIFEGQILSSSDSNRRDLWQDLRYQNLLYSHRAWVIMGDFNVILNNQGKLGKYRADRHAIRDFNEWVQDLDLAPIPSSGFKYTVQIEEKVRIGRTLK